MITGGILAILFDFLGENMVSKKIKQNHKITVSHLTKFDLYSSGVIEKCQ
jgi:hypothetical protein